MMSWGTQRLSSDEFTKPLDTTGRARLKASIFLALSLQNYVPNTPKAAD